MNQGPRMVVSTDPDRAISELAREHDALATMTGADSARIDVLVDNVGQIKGNVNSVKDQLDGVITGVNKLNDAMAGLVRFEMKVEHTHSQQEAQRLISSAHEKRIQDVERRLEPLTDMKLGERLPTLEKQIGPLIEMRGWVILLVLGAGGLVVAKIATLLGN